MNLVIGSTSQLARYFPEDYIKISSRNVDLEYLKNNQWDSVYITFAEQRIYDTDIDYITPNYLYTFKIIESLVLNSKKIVCYGSCELWNNLCGKISIDIPPNFKLNSEYAISKLLLWNKIKEKNKSVRAASFFKNVMFIHPFYFNSVYRSEYFLFGKIFKSIINKEKISLSGNLDFYRDMVSPQFVVNKSIELQNDEMVGSGQLFSVKTFVKDLYQLNNMKYEDFVEEQNQKPTTTRLPIYADVPWKYTYENLLEDTQKDILSVRDNGYNR